MKTADYRKRYKDKTLQELTELQKALISDASVPEDCLTAVLQLITEAQPVTVEEAKRIDVHSDYALAKQYMNKISSCMKRGIDFKLSINEYNAIKNKKVCYYTGIKFDDTHINQLTIDRIDSSKGYTKENSVACCNQVNALKNSLFECDSRLTTITVKQLGRLIDKLVSCGIK